MDLNPWERRQKLLEVLCLRRHETTDNLAHEFNVSRETIRRDIRILTCSYPVETVSGGHGGIRVAEWFHLDRRALNSAELCGDHISPQAGGIPQRPRSGNAQPDYRHVFTLRGTAMKVRISSIKINPGRREAEPKAIEELAKSITAVGLLNPITVDQNNTLVAGLHRLEAAKLLGWAEIECNSIGMSSLQAELAEIDENIVRTRLSRQELGEQFLRRKEIYEMLHPETKAGVAQAAGMNRAIGNNVGDKLAPTSKSFVKDTSEKTGMSKRTVSRLLQIANNMTQDAKRIVRVSDIPQETALKISRLPSDQQAEAASLLAAGTVQSVEQYRQERREKILAARPPLPDEPPEDTRTEAEKDQQKKESLDSLAREFTQFIGQYLDRMKMYQGYADAFAEMSQTQISRVWDSVAAVSMAIIAFSKEVKAIQAENEDGGNKHEN